MTCAGELGHTHATERRKLVTILFADMKGSTEMGERLDPEAVRGVMSTFYALARGVLERHGGTVEKFIGDAVMAVFGVPRVHEDDAIRAVRAAVGLREALEVMNEKLVARHGVTLQLRTGVNTGEVVAGDPGAQSSFVSGDAVNVAARFEQAAPPGEILIGEPTYRLVSSLVEAEPVPPLTLKGKADPVPAFRVERVLEVDTRPRLVSPLIGRDHDRETLLRAFAEVRQEGRPATVLALGAAGIGKSRLLEDVRFALEGDARVIAIRADATETVLPRLIFALLGGEPAVVVSELMAGREQAALVADALNRAQDDVVQPAEVAWALGQICGALARERPLVLVLDDAHMSDDEELQTITDAVAGSGGPALLLIGGREDLREEHADWLEKLGADTQTLELQPLTDDACARIVDQLLGGGLDTATVARLIQGAGGNPLFLAETLRMLLDEGALRRGPNGWETAQPIEELAMPTSIRAVLAARLDLLPDDERAILEAASVLGATFTIADIRAIHPEQDAPTTLLDRLVERDLLADDSPDPGGLRFRHRLVRDAAYDGMTMGSRAELHERAANHQEAAGAVETVAEHLGRAWKLRLELGGIGEPERALAARTATSMVEAALASLERGDGERAAELLHRAAEPIDHLEPDVADGLRRRGADLAFRLGDWDAVLHLLEPVDVDTDPAAMKQLGDALTRSHRDDSALLERGRGLLRAAADAAGDPEALSSLAGTWKGIDDERARALYREAHELDPAHPYALGNYLEYEIRATSDLSPVAAARSGIEGAIGRCRDEIAAGENLPWAWFDLGKFLLLLGQPDGSELAYAAAVARSTAHFQITTSRRSLDGLLPFAGGLFGLEEDRRLMTLGVAGRFPDEADGAKLRPLSTPGAWPLVPPIAILAGGSSRDVDAEVRGYAESVLGALEAWNGTVISGGTRQGVSVLAGDAGERGVRIVGYLPSSAPADVEIDDDPRRYGELRRSDGSGFGVREPLRYWADILTSGIAPAGVRLVAIGGGQISSFEYRLALALGAHVGAVAGSGDAAADLLRDPMWSASGRVEELSPTAGTVSGFLTAS